MQQWKQINLCRGSNRILTEQSLQVQVLSHHTNKVKPQVSLRLFYTYSWISNHTVLESLCHHWIQALCQGCYPRFRGRLSCRRALLSNPGSKLASIVTSPFTSIISHHLLSKQKSAQQSVTNYFMLILHFFRLKKSHIMSFLFLIRKTYLK